MIILFMSSTQKLEQKDNIEDIIMNFKGEKKIYLPTNIYMRSNITNFVNLVSSINKGSINQNIDRELSSECLELI